MTTIQEPPDPKKPTQPLNKLFHVLFTRGMYTELEVLSTRFKLSKGAIIRLAIENYIRRLKEQKSVGPWTDLSYQAI